ncbi:MAG: hypothetical protein JW786_13585 [Desulfobacterales bacterium]|nr:hypothetical protein [Desulfobacterales bacterium]
MESKHLNPQKIACHYPKCLLEIEPFEIEQIFFHICASFSIATAAGVIDET